MYFNMYNLEHNKKLNQLKAQGIATIAGKFFKVKLN